MCIGFPGTVVSVDELGATFEVVDTDGGATSVGFCA